MGALDDEHIASLLDGLVHLKEKNNFMVISEKSKLLGTMKSEQKSRVDLEQISDLGVLSLACPADPTPQVVPSARGALSLGIRIKSGNQDLTSFFY